MFDVFMGAVTIITILVMLLVFVVIMLGFAFIMLQTVSPAAAEVISEWADAKLKKLFGANNA